MLETLLTVTRKIRHCKTCEANCEKEKPIVGCESIMAPMPLLEICGKTYDTECSRRTWFDRNYKVVDFYRWPTHEEFEKLSPEEWRARLAEELLRIQMVGIKA